MISLLENSNYWEDYCYSTEENLTERIPSWFFTTSLKIKSWFFLNSGTVSWTVSLVPHCTKQLSSNYTIFAILLCPLLSLLLLIKNSMAPSWKRTPNITSQALLTTTSIWSYSGDGLVLALFKLLSLSGQRNNSLKALENIDLYFRFMALSTNFVTNDGYMVGFFSSGMMAYSSLIICANLKILLFSSTISVLNLFFIFGSILFYIGNFALFDSFKSSPNYTEFEK